MRKSGSEFEESVKQLINDLPTTNRDTLAFIVLHLLNMSISEEYKSIICELFCPIIAGDTEVVRKLKLIKQLFSLPEDYWITLLANNFQ